MTALSQAGSGPGQPLPDLATPSGWPTRGLQPHPFANIVPLPGAAERADMVASIKARGLQHRIVIHEDQILDGRTRYLAGIEAGLFPKPVEDWRTDASFIEFGGDEWDPRWGTDPLEFVWDENEIRRHESPSQRSMAASLYGQLKRPAEASTPDLLGDPAPAANLQETVAKRAEKAGVSERMVATTDNIARRGAPELQQAVLDDKIAAHEAEKLLDLPAEEQKAVAEAGDRKAVRAAAKEAAPKRAADKAESRSAQRADLLSSQGLSPDLQQLASEPPAKSAARMMPSHGRPYVSFAHYILDLIKGDGSAPPEDVTLEAFGIVKLARAFGILDGDAPSAAFAQHLDDVGGPLPLPMERRPVPALGDGALILELDLGDSGSVQLCLKVLKTGGIGVKTALTMPIVSAMLPYQDGHKLEEVAVWHGVANLGKAVEGIAGTDGASRFKADFARIQHWLGEIAAAWDLCDRPDQLADVIAAGEPKPAKAARAKPAARSGQEATRSADVKSDASLPQVASEVAGEAVAAVTSKASPAAGVAHAEEVDPKADPNGFIRRHYGTMPNAEIADILDLAGPNAVKQRAKRMGIGDPDNQKAAVAAANRRRAEASA